MKRPFYSQKLAVLLFGAEKRVLSEPMLQRLDGVHVGLLRQVIKLKAKILRDGSWRKATANKVLQRAGTQPIRTYLDRRQATVAEWVALRHTFNVYARETSYKGGGKLQDPWWRKAAADKHLRVTLKYILVAARDQRQRESGRGGRGEGGEEGEVTGSDR